METAAPVDIPKLAERIRQGANRAGSRRIIGLVGAPGTGKTTLAQLLEQELGAEQCVVVPMDGFHLANVLLDGTPLRARKGAIDTFDIGGYLSLLRRIRAQDEPVVYAPAYRRGLEDAIAASIAVPRTTKFIITEGNYLLSEEGSWREIRSLLDEAWFVETPDKVRIARLIERHVASGMDRESAVTWARTTDETNARFVAGTRHNADRIIPWP